MQTLAAPVAMHRALPAEEVARGDFYALLARMLHAAPDAALLSSLATAPALPDEGAPALARAWRDLVDASSVMDAEAAAAEFESLFVGVGKAAVSVYAGFYGGAPSIDHPRVRIQADMAALGLARRDTASEPEDHYAGLLDVMRVLAQGGAGRSAAALPEQQRFFETHLGQGLAMFFAALGKSEHANYYRKVAAFGAAFTVLETESFSLE